MRLGVEQANAATKAPARRLGMPIVALQPDRRREGRHIEGKTNLPAQVPQTQPIL